MNNTLGLYIHVPFCDGRCTYCSFYSTTGQQYLMDKYCESVNKELCSWGEKQNYTVDTIYLGGGTPSLLGGMRIAGILSAARASFYLDDNAEITMEANPSAELNDTLSIAAKAGINRVSFGVQSANENELSVLGRRHTNSQVEAAVKAARNAGINNISLDLMLAIPYQTKESLARSVNFAAKLEPQHISAYILKVEKDTKMFSGEYPLFDDDAAADMYAYGCELIEKHGYRQYEISNFARDGFESRHNNRYWKLYDYIGIGPSAHSFFNKKRFYTPPQLNDFLKEARYIDDCIGGGYDEFIMLSLRLTEGLSFYELEKRYGICLNEKAVRLISALDSSGLCIMKGNSLSLTRRGMLVSNSIITELISALEEK